MSLPDVSMTFRPTQQTELELHDEGTGLPKLDPNEPYLASGMVPVNIKALRERRTTSE